MKRIKITIEYDGTRYSGWQKQPNELTIQGEIEKAIENSIGEKVEVFGSGRTDAGVHALGQTAHFDLVSPVPTEKLAMILNNALPDDIVVKDAVEVDENFHARFSIKKKCYQYRILNRTQKDAFLANRVCFIKYPLDISKMKEAAKLIEGKHDFQGFCSAQTQATNFEREVFSIDVHREGDFVYVDVCGSGFLYNMVRIIVGTMVDYALDKLTKEDIINALEDGDRAKSGQTLPPQGLYLKETIY
jgi:tRNA pseudouridine38-40 synthase